MSYSLVWFKRDLRWQDHEALAQAAKLGAVRCIYVVEPELWMQADAALQHFEFVRESLQDLDAHLRTLGGCIEIHTGEVPDVLQKIWQVAPFSRLYAHEETGNAFTYARDLKVAAWCQAHSVHWQEFAQFGVVRRLKNRNLWQAAWEKHMASSVQNFTSVAFYKPPSTAPFVMSAPHNLKHNPPLRQRGGRVLALATLHSFLNARSIGYRGGISSPLSARHAGLCGGLPTLAALAACRRMAGHSVFRLRTRHSLEPIANAIGYHRHQHHPRVQPHQTSARSRPPWGVCEAMVAIPSPCARHLAV